MSLVQSDSFLRQFANRPTKADAVGGIRDRPLRYIETRSRLFTDAESRKQLRDRVEGNSRRVSR